MLEYNIRESFCTKGPRIRGKSKRFKKPNRKTTGTHGAQSYLCGLAAMGLAGSYQLATAQTVLGLVQMEASERTYQYQMRQAEQASKYAQSSGLSGYAASSAAQGFGVRRDTFGTIADPLGLFMGGA